MISSVVSIFQLSYEEKCLKLKKISKERSHCFKENTRKCTDSVFICFLRTSYEFHETNHNENAQSMLICQIMSLMN